MMMVIKETTKLAELTVDLFNRASDDAELGERMSFANTTVHIYFTDPEGDECCTVWLDREPIGAEMGAVGEAAIVAVAPCPAVEQGQGRLHASSRFVAAPQAAPGDGGHWPLRPAARHRGARSIHRIAARSRQPRGAIADRQAKLNRS